MFVAMGLIYRYVTKQPFSFTIIAKEFIYWIKVVIIISRTFGSRYLSYRTVDRMIYMVIFSYVLDVEFNWNFRYFYVKKIS